MFLPQGATYISASQHAEPPRHHRLHLNARADGDVAIAFVLVSTSPGQEREVRDRIAMMEGVSEVTLLFGDHDLIARIELETLGDIARTVVEQMRSLDGVVGTRTLAGADPGR